MSVARQYPVLGALPKLTTVDIEPIIVEVTNAALAILLADNVFTAQVAADVAVGLAADAAFKAQVEALITAATLQNPLNNDIIQGVLNDTVFMNAVLDAVQVYVDGWNPVGAPVTWTGITVTPTFQNMPTLPVATVPAGITTRSRRQLGTRTIEYAWDDIIMSFTGTVRPTFAGMFTIANGVATVPVGARPPAAVAFSLAAYRRFTAGGTVYERPVNAVLEIAASGVVTITLQWLADSSYAPQVPTSNATDRIAIYADRVTYPSYAI